MKKRVFWVTSLFVTFLAMKKVSEFQSIRYENHLKKMKNIENGKSKNLF